MESESSLAADVEEIANGPAAGKGIGNHDRLKGSIGKNAGKSTDELTDDIAERLAGMEEDDGAPDSEMNDDDLFGDDTPSHRAPQLESDETLAQ